MQRLRTIVVTLLTAVLVVGVAGTASASESGNEAACTPGYWKNHVDNWLEDPGVLIPATKTLGSAFDLPDELAAYEDVTFLDALSFKGGPGVEGAARTLLKHAVAAFLNAAYDDGAGNLQYPLRRNSSTSFYPTFDGIRPETDAALASLDRGTMLDLKDFFDGIANSLPCPLS